MNDNFQGSHGWRTTTTRDRRYQPPRMTGLQLAGEVVGWLAIAAVLIGGATFLQLVFGTGVGQ